jgi:hypothetical protein
MVPISETLGFSCVRVICSSRDATQRIGRNYLSREVTDAPPKRGIRNPNERILASRLGRHRPDDASFGNIGLVQRPPELPSSLTEKEIEAWDLHARGMSQRTIALSLLGVAIAAAALAVPFLSRL